jgi:hypothetical protein
VDSKVKARKREGDGRIRESVGNGEKKSGKEGRVEMADEMKV